jgi:DNA-binding response OmpR family regulator
MTKRILVVDDETSIRESLNKILRAENYEVVMAENGQTAIERHGTQRIDVLILDLNMPVKNGWVTLEWLTQINPLLPVVVITGRSDQSLLAQMAGADALMEKPLNVPLLLETIRGWMDEPMENRAERASRRGSGYRHMPYDDWQLREMQLQRSVSDASIRCLPENRGTSKEC